MKSTLLLIPATVIFTCISLFISAQSTYIPDDNFEQTLIDLGYDSGAPNDSVYTDSINQVTTLDLAGKAISSIEGIEAFINLQDLNISNNQLTSVDLSFNDKLTGLICFNNQLTELYLSANTQLTNLNCSNNQIEILDLSLASSLQYLNCSNNNLSSLNIRNGNNPLMTGVDYRITGIDTRNNPALYCIDVDNPTAATNYNTWFKDKWTSFEINCSSYKVEMTYVPDDNFEQYLINLGCDTGPLNDSVPTAPLKKIDYLNVNYRGIKSLTGIESFESLSRLYCSRNEIINLELSNNKLLTQLDCSYNKISSLDISQNELLTSVFCNYNQIIDIDASYNTFLTNINCSYNLLTGLNVRNGNNTNLQLNAGSNTNLFCIQVDDVALANSKAYWYKNAYTAYSEDCANFTPEMTYVPDDNFEQALIYLGLDTNNLNDSIPTISLKSLKSLNVSHKNISDLTGIKDFDALEELYCYSNQIAEIDLSSNSNLKKLQIQNNNLIDLDLSANSLLTTINVSYNQLTGLNLKNGNNSNMSTEARYNSNLLCIQVDDSEATYGYSNWYKNAYTAYTEDCSSYTPEMTYVPDDNFEQALINLRLDFDENINDSVPTIALYSLKSLNLNSKSIHDFTGIQSCVNLKYFNCRSNYMDSLDLTKNRELMDLDCSYNSLKELDISENNNLTKLICNDNSLTNIVFSKHDFLEFINCSNNEIEEISEIESNSLTTFYCESNKLTKLDLFKLPSLVQLVCRDNNLNELDVSSNAQLTTLIAERNLLTFVNLQNGNNENLDLDLYQNMPACIQVDDTVFAQSKPKNEWSIDDWSYYSENCSGHIVDMVYIPDDNFEKALLEQRYDDGKLNDSIPIAIAEHIVSLNIDNSNISDLTGIEYFVNLGGLRCCNNNLDKLDLSKNTNLSSLYCYNNNITSLKIDSCIELIRLYCGNNQITEIDVSRFNKLYRFSCYSNKIVNLDLSNNPDILYLGAYSNLLSSLNIKNRNNPDFQFNVQNNPNLFCIEVDDAYSAVQNAKWYKDETAYYSEDCSNKSAMTYIPDDNFEQALIDLGYDSGELDDSVLTAKIFSVTSLNIPNKGIKSLEGIQGFEQLIGLNCYNNSIEELDLSKNKKLKYLRCQNNNLHFLNYKNGNNSNNTFNATYNPFLFCIEVDDYEASSNYSNWEKDIWADYSEDCSGYFDKKTYIPDDNFEQALIDLGYDSGELDDSVSTSVIEKITELRLQNKNISNLKGIEDFISLEGLYCNSNNIQELNLATNSMLLYLDCSQNQLISLNVANNKSLMRLTCHENFLSELDLTQNLELEHLICYDNDVVTLNLENNSKLLYLQCYNNNLSELNIKNGNNLEMVNYSTPSMIAYENPNLRCIQVDDAIAANNFEGWLKDEEAVYSENCNALLTQMTYIPDDNFEQALIDLGYDSGELDDSVATMNIIKVTNLNISRKQIRSIEGIQDFSLLKELQCYDNLLTNLNIKSNKSLERLSCYSNLLTSLDVSDNINLVTLACYNNQIDSFNVSKNLQLETLAIENNNLSVLDVKNNRELIYLTCSGNSLSSLDVSNNKKLEVLRCGHNNISLLNLNSNDQLISLDCISCKISDLDLSNNRSLQFLDCSANLLTTLNLSSNNSLGDLLCPNNILQNLTIGNNTSIYRIICYNNKIEEIDVSGCPILRSFDCHENNLLKLNVRNGNNQNMTSNESSGDRMWAHGNPNLSCIEVDDPAASRNYPNWIKDAWTNYSENCGNILGAGVPHSEYEALEDLYYSTNGNSWTNNTNWLDTINASVEDWYGVTVENGHVTKIVLNENNLQNEAFTEKAHLPELRVIELGDNELTGFNFYAIDSLYSLDTIMLNNNRLIFDDISPAFSNSNFSNFSNHFYYQEQQEVDYFQDLIAVIRNPFELALSDSFISVNDRFQWYKDGQRLEGKTNSTLSFESIAFADSGAYHVEITNANVPDLVLKSQFKIVNTYYGVAAGKGVPDKEYEALVDFYNSTNGADWLDNTNWLDTVTHTVADWFGITVENGHVTKIYFGPYENYNLNGSIPNSIKNLTRLVSFEIVTDKLNGELPAGLFELTNLKKLYLSECNISGSLPTEIGNLTKLEILGLEANNLQGNIPMRIGNLTKLKSLSLQENNLTGPIPFELGALVNLEYLGLSDNQLTEEIPTSFGDLINLKWLLLDHNQLSGTIPTELDKLTKLVMFAIDHNLFGQTINTKSAVSNSVENHRVIPDFVSNFVDLDTFSIANNQIQFNDIEAIFNWDNFNDINEFEYAPQAKIGVEKTIESEEETIISLSIENYYPAPSDQYQWFKNNEKLNGAINDKLEFASLATEDAGIYYCQVSNTKVPNLILTSNEIQLVITEKIPVDTVPDQEYNALVNLVNAFPDINFGENWLDTTSSKVKDWQGITVRNGHVVALDLSNLNIDGDVFNIFSAFDSLEWVNLSGNNLNGTFPTFNGEKSRSDIKSVKENAYNLKYLNIANNRFMFSDLEPVADELLTIDTFIYSPQQLLGHDIDTSVYKNVSLTIKIDDYRSGEYDIQNWYRNDTYNFVDQEEFIINSVELADSGSYHLQVTNSRFEDLVLQSAPWNLAVMSPVGIKDLKLSDFEVYPNPAKTSLFIDTKNTNVKIELYNTSGNKVLAFEQFTGGWINIAKYPKGLYLLKLDTENSSYSEKVLFK